MKTTLSIALLLIVFVAGAQNRSDFSLNLSERSVILKPGESKSMTISIERSKGFTKGDVKLSLSSVLPQGITINYEPAVGHFDSSVATITASSSVPVGNYQLVLNATIQNKTKGTILKVAVSNDAIAVK